MEKHFELIGLGLSNGWYVARCYNRLGGYDKYYRFAGYSKRDVIYKLRHEYGVIVRRGF